MKRKLLTGLVLGIFLLPMLALGQQAPQVGWNRISAPVLYSGEPGDNIKMEGQVEVKGTLPFSGKLQFQIWGHQSDPAKACNIVCGGSGAVCYDWDACQGQNCG